MSEQQIGYVDKRFFETAQSLAQAILVDHVNVTELALAVTAREVFRINPRSCLVQLHYMTASGEDLLIKILFIREEGELQLTAEDGIELMIQEEFLRWYLAEAHLSGGLTRVLEMTAEECFIGLSDISEMYEFFAWQGFAPAEDWLLVQEITEEFKYYFEVLSKYKPFFPED